MMMMAIAHMIVRLELPMRNFISWNQGRLNIEDRKYIIKRKRATGTRLDLSPSLWGGYSMLR
jgi:hypothetical protein